MPNLLAPNGGIPTDDCDCSTAVCVPGTVCPPPKPGCPDTCASFTNCSSGNCIDAEQFTAVVTWQGTYIQDGVQSAWGSYTSYAQYQYVFRSVGSTGPSASYGTITLELTYGGSLPYPPCVQVSINAMAQGDIVNNGFGGVGSGLKESSGIIDMVVDSTTGKARASFSLSASSKGTGAVIGWTWLSL